MGAVVLPLFTLFGEEAVEYRLSNAEASAVITDMANVPKILAVRDRLPHLKTIVVIGAAARTAARSSTGTGCWTPHPTASPRWIPTRKIPPC